MTSEEDVPEPATLGDVVQAVLVFWGIVLAFVLAMRFVFPGDVGTMPAFAQALLGRSAYQLGKAVAAGWGGVMLRLGWSAMAMFSVVMLGLAVTFAVGALRGTVSVVTAVGFVPSVMVGAVLPWLLLLIFPVLEIPIVIACLVFWFSVLVARFRDAIGTVTDYAQGT